MKAIAVMVATVLIAGCEKQKSDEVLTDLPYGKWVHIENKDALTDIKTSSTILKSWPVSDGNPSPVEMHFRCSEGRLDFYLSWNRYVGSDPLVDTRIDSDPHQPNTWEASTNGESTFYPFFNSAYLDRLASSTSYIARVSAPDRDITAKFDTSKLQQETKTIREECKI